MCLISQALAYASDDIKASIVNFYPGEEIYELEGHTVLRIQANGEDMAVSYGTFDFEAPNFVYRFCKGETDYWVTMYPYPLFEQSYKSQNRRIVEHPLLLDSAQAVKLVQLVAENMLPQNRTYRYNYVKDNCAIRPLKLVQKALGDSIALPLSGLFPEGTSFRDVMRYYHSHYPWYQFGIDLALGSGIDYPIDAWGEAFAPVLLDKQLDRATVIDSATGNARPLSAEAIVLYEGADATLAPTPWYLTPMAIALLVLAVSIAFTIRDIKRCKVTKWWDATLFGIFGIMGLVLAFLVFISTHEATSPNILLLWLNPLCLIVPIFIWLKKCNIAVISYQFVNFALILAMLIVWPIAGQSLNGAFLPLIVADMIRALNYIYVSKSKHNYKIRK